MHYVIYHTATDAFVYNGTEPVWASEDVKGDGTVIMHEEGKEVRYLFCNFRINDIGVIIKMYEFDMEHLFMCHNPNNVFHSFDHKRLYEFLVSIGMEYVRFIPRFYDTDSDGHGFDYINGFKLDDWYP